MHIHADYIVPITTWLHDHPNQALLFTYLISFVESLAIIGTLIPGSITMTAIGVLAGSGVMRFDLTLCFATLGAFCGDGVSYILGFIYSTRLSSIWPFKRYPSLLNYGQDFFNRHGKKSVLIGRFIGPLRSITPLIAGMMHMPRLHFIIANFISAIGWSILYLLPGYLIGEASTQLSSDSARRLFFFVLVLAVAIWIISHILRAFTKNLTQSFTHFVNTLWILSKTNAYCHYVITKLTNREDKKQQKVIQLLAIWFANLSGTLLLCGFVIQNTWIAAINGPTSLFLQTLRTPIVDQILIIFTFILSPLSLLAFSMLVALINIYNRDWRFLRYWISLFISALLITSLGAEFIATPTIHLFGDHPQITVFPVGNLCLATTLFSFLINYVLKNHKDISYALSVCLISLLVISGFATLYLGDNWLTSVLSAYSIGCTLGLIHWILYRRTYSNPHTIYVPILLSFILFAMATAVVYTFEFKNTVYRHTQKLKQYTLNLDTWWYQNEPILPLYSTNRLGKRIGVFNLQYAGSIRELEKRLITCGWQKQSKSFLYSLLIHAEGRQVTDTLPFMGQLYLNKLPILTMSYHVMKDDNLYILRLWRSNYHLLHYQEPIWLGNIILARKKSDTPQSSFAEQNSDPSHLFMHILPAVHDYQITRMPVKDPHLQSLPYEIPSELLIIKN